MLELKAQVRACLERFRAGELKEENLQMLLAQLEKAPRQSLLYLQTSSTHPRAQVIGMSLFEQGRDPEELDEEGKFLYDSVCDALEDGWRVIKFPEMSMTMDDRLNYGLGCEFILERWR